ncbi:hypothetical protein BH11BAC5_BH11BAC5_53440 [soil metagenome]
MRSKDGNKNKNPTMPQLSQQLKFKLCTQFLQTMSGLVSVGFKTFAVKKTGMNSALSYLLQNAVTGAYPTFTIVYSDVLVSRGDLPNVLGPSVVAGAGSVVTFSWTDNSSVGSAKPTDKAILAAYCPAFSQCIYTTGSADRSAITDSIDLSTFTGQLVETYIGFISADGKTVATSIYTGQVTVS